MKGGLLTATSPRPRKKKPTSAVHADLDRSLSLLTATFESTADALQVTDLEGRTLRWNRKFADMWEVPEAILGALEGNGGPGSSHDLTTYMLYKLKNHEPFFHRLREFRRNPDLESMDVLELLDGKVIECYSLPQRVGGETVGRVTSFRDITDRRRAEDELKLLQRIILATHEAEDLNAALAAALRLVCEATGWPLGQAWLPRPDGAALECSEAWYTRSIDLEEFRRVSEQLVVAPGDDLPGVAWATGAPVWLQDFNADSSPRAAAAPEAELWSALALPVLAGTEVVAVLEFFLAERRDEDERVVMFLSAASRQLGTLIQRKRSQDLLRAAETRFEAIFQSLPYAAVFTDTDFRIVLTNPAFTETFGYRPHEILGQPMSLLYAEAWPADGTGREIRYRRKSGEEFMAETAEEMVRDPAGSALGRMAVIRDVTERIRLEQQVLEAQKMDAIGQLAGGVAHDFNNVLTVIYGYTSMLLRILGPNRQGRDVVERIRQATARASALTKQLLAFSRKQVVQCAILDLNGVLADLDDMLRSVLGDHIDLVTHLTPGLGRVSADPSQMEQMIVNLAVNARDAMPEGGVITVEIADAEMDAERIARLGFVAGADGGPAGPAPGPYVVLAVADTGCGMDAATRARIFEPFFTTKPRGKGTGLGLSTLYGIVHQSGGHVRVESEPGRGSRFEVYLPRVAEAQAPAAGSDSAGEAPGGNETILLVEDQEALRELIRDILKERGYRVLSAHDGSEALRVSAGHEAEIHLLMTDVVMPGMSGREVARRLVARRPALRVLYTSGYTQDGAVRDVVGPGADFLEKPFTEEKLARKVREVLDRGNGK